jgi:hypothetical protein
MARHRTKRNRKTSGAGYGFDLSRGIFSTVVPYSGAGKDCAAPPSNVSLASAGLPGLSGGARRKSRRGRRNRRRTQGGVYGFTKGVSGEMLSSPAPFERIGCRGMTGGAALSPAYYAGTAGYSQHPELIPGSAAGGMLRTVAYPDRSFTPACMATRGGARRNRRNRKSRRNH